MIHGENIYNYIYIVYIYSIYTSWHERGLAHDVFYTKIVSLKNASLLTLFFWNTTCIYAITLFDNARIVE